MTGEEARRIGLSQALEHLGAWFDKWRRVDAVTDDDDDLDGLACYEKPS